MSSVRPSGHKTGRDVVLLVILILLVHWRSLEAGLFLDDFAVLARLDAWREGGPEATWWELYVLGGFDPRLRFSGLLPWWSAQEVRVHFFRPLSAATHALDVVMWRDQARYMHLHSVAWLCGATIAARSLFRQRLGRRVATLAATVFAVSYVHAWPTGWVSNRNALIALTFSTLAVRAYLISRDSERIPWASGLWLGTAFLASESAIATLGYLVAYELTAGRTRPRGRGLGMAVVVLVAAGWRTAYSLAGFGAHGSGAYVDPIHAPSTFADVAPERLTTLLRDLATPTSALPLADSSAFLVELVLVLLMVPVVSHGLKARGRLWLFGSLMALIPMATSVAQARLLGPAIVGLAPLVAEAVTNLWTSGRRLNRLLCVAVALPHLLISPLISGRIVAQAGLADGLPLGSPGLHLGELRGRNLIVLDTPSLAIAQEVNSARARQGLTTATFTWVLSVGDVSLTRQGCCTVVAEDPRGLFRERWSALYRGPQVPFEVGDRVETLAYEARVIGVSPRGHATGVAFEFGGPLRSPQYVLARWDGDDFVRIRPRDLPRE